MYYFVLVFINSFIQYQRRELKSTKKSQLVLYNKSFNKNNSIFFTPQGKHEMHKIISIFSFLCRISNIFWSIVRHNGKHFEATSKEYTEHFMTFLEQWQSASTEICPDKAMPSRSGKSLDRCDVCSSWSFLSKIEKAKHYRLFHSKHKIPKLTSTEKKSKAHKCNYKENGIQCNAVFLSYHKLK